MGYSIYPAIAAIDPPEGFRIVGFGDETGWQWTETEACSPPYNFPAGGFWTTLPCVVQVFPFRHAVSAWYGITGCEPDEANLIMAAVSSVDVLLAEFIGYINYNPCYRLHVPGIEHEVGVAVIGPAAINNPLGNVSLHDLGAPSGWMYIHNSYDAWLFSDAPLNRNGLIAEYNNRTHQIFWYWWQDDGWQKAKYWYPVGPVGPVGHKNASLIPILAGVMLLLLLFLIAHPALTTLVMATPSQRLKRKKS